MVDKSIEPKVGKIVVAAINGELNMKPQSEDYGQLLQRCQGSPKKVVRSGSHSIEQLVMGCYFRALGPKAKSE